MRYNLTGNINKLSADSIGICVGGNDLVLPVNSSLVGSM